MDNNVPIIEFELMDYKIADPPKKCKIKCKLSKWCIFVGIDGKAYYTHRNFDIWLPYREKLKGKIILLYGNILILYYMTYRKTSFIINKIHIRR